MWVSNVLAALLTICAVPGFSNNSVEPQEKLVFLGLVVAEVKPAFLSSPGLALVVGHIKLHVFLCRPCHVACPARQKGLRWQRPHNVNFRLNPKNLARSCGTR